MTRIKQKNEEQWKANEETLTKSHDDSLRQMKEKLAEEKEAHENTVSQLKETFKTKEKEIKEDMKVEFTIQIEGIRHAEQILRSEMENERASFEQKKKQIINDHQKDIKRREDLMKKKEEDFSKQFSAIEKRMQEST